MFTKSFVVIALISLSFLFCCPILPNPRVVHRPAPETLKITSANLVTQEVKMIDNPLSGEFINCSVIASITKEDNSWVKIEREEFESINIIEDDINGRMWLATDGRGLSMFDGKEWHNWQPEAGRDIGHVTFRTMAVSDKKIYAGAYGSASGGKLLVYDIEQDRWDTIKGLSGNVVGGVAMNQQGQIFAATTAGVNIYNNGRWTRLKMPLSSMFTIPLVADALFDKRGNYWMATEIGLWKYDGKAWTTFTMDDGFLPANEIKALAVDGANRIWVATTNGLAVYDENENWRVFSTERYPWFSGWLNNVAVDPEDRVWVVSNDFLTVYNGKEIATFKPSIVGASLWDDAIGFDQQGCTWVDISSQLVILRERLAMEAGEFHFE